MKRFGMCLGLGLILLLTATDGSAQDYEKLAQSGMEFLNVKSDAEAAAMAGAVTTLEMGSRSLFFNPAGMARLGGKHWLNGDVSFSANRWIADIEHGTFSAAVSPARGRYGVVGISLQYVDYGDLQWTMADLTQDKGYRDIDEDFSPYALAAGLGYALAITDRFSVGGQVHWIRQQLGQNYVPDGAADIDTVKNEVSPFSFDFGTIFKTGFKSLAFGMSIRNFSKEYKFEHGKEEFQLPLIFAMGIGMDVLDLLPSKGIDQSLWISVDAVHHRSRPEQVLVGLNYTILQMLSVRVGYAGAEDENDFSFGIGAGFKYAYFDYAYTPFGIFDSVQRVTMRASF